MNSTVNLAEWEPQQRRTGSIAALVAALVLAAAGVGTWFFVKEKAAVLYWVLVGLLALVLLFVVAVLVLGIRAERARAHPAFAPHIGPAGPGVMEEPAQAPAAPQTMTLRCGDCNTVFDITDTGDRPLYHTCPGCGAEGVLRAPAAPAEAAPAPAPAAAPSAAPEPESAWAPPQETPAEVSPAATVARRLKLRCGGCKEIFVIDDTGERPLRRPCPHCSRMGEIK